MKTVTKIHQMVMLNIINIGFVVFWAVDGAFMTNYLTKKEFCFSPFGMSDASAGNILLIGQLMVVVGLIIGYWSDRTRTKFGKRRPYMLGGAMLAAFLYCMIPFTNNLAIVIGLQILVYFFIVFASIPYYSLIPDATPGEKLSTCNAFFSLFGAIGTIGGYAVIGGMLTDQVKYPELYRFLPFFVTAGILVFFAILTVLTTKEDTDYSKLPPVEKGSAIKWASGLIAGLKTNKPLAWFMVFNFLLWFGLQGFVKFFTRFMDNDQGVPLDTASIALGLLPIVVMLLAVPVGILGDKMNRKNLLMFGVLLTFGAMLAGYFIIPKNLTGAEKIKREQQLAAENAKAEKTAANAGDKSMSPECANMRVDVQKLATAKEYEYQQCLAKKFDPACSKQSDILSKFGELKNEPLKTTAIILSFAAAGLCIVFLLMAAIAPTLMPPDKIGEYMGLLSATTGLGGVFGLFASGGLSTLLQDTLHCRVIFIIGFVCLGIGLLVLMKVKIPNPWELAAQAKQDKK